MDKEKKYKIISAGVTTATMLLLMVFMICCGFTEMVPPPPAKKAIMIELTSGGGGGGGTPIPQQKNNNSSSEEPVATQNAVDAPVINKTGKSKPNENSAPKEVKPDQNSLYKPGRGGSGSNGGSGSGSGSGTGSGLGPGEGSGSGGGIGYGYGNRNYTIMPNMQIQEDGVVYVEVHVDADGKVIDARVISNKKYPTTITNSQIQAECISRAKTAQYVKGKEELRIIIFHQ